MRHAAMSNLSNKMRDCLLNVAIFLIQNRQCRILLDKTTRVADIDSSLPLITGQHPHLDIGSSQLFNSLWHALLQLILDSSGTSKLQLLLNLLASVFDFLLPINEASASLIVSSLPVRVGRFIQESVAIQQSP